MVDHTVRAFDIELQDLARRITEMGGIAESMLGRAVEALVKGDLRQAEEVIGTDAGLDELEREVNDKAILLIARRQPMAVDLRFIASTMKLAGDIERIGDLAKNIGKRVKAIGVPFHHPSLVTGVTHLGDMAQDRLRQVLDAYARRDLDAAMEVWRHDDDIDALHNSLFRELLTYMMEDPRNITFCTHLLFCAKNIERVGDHCTNIAEIMHYMLTGGAVNQTRPRAGAVTEVDLAINGDTES
ncbi:MAG TPA: phosphate signaling complex protein PhoU [Beijerinckiaceae bacterium]|nr:phosphate signaling complex protein PhoU [Beijerinckiaceae bacterium]